MRISSQEFVPACGSARSIAACRRDVLDAARALDEIEPGQGEPREPKAKPVITQVNATAIPFGSDYLRMREISRGRAVAVKRKLLVALAVLDVVVIAWSLYEILPPEPQVHRAAHAKR